ncbi:Phosducin [Tupaia chinensis]|uniref:Phosducin n=1 Tax=Tupaia chinensis TaxID=246437 RepID=L8YHA1_TUPCH|nr:Phosducin [Tupaia chinensis]
MSSLVVAWDGNVHIAQRRICVAQGNGRWINIRRLCERLVAGPGISHHQKTRVPEGHLDLVREGSRSEAINNRSGSSGSSELQRIPLSSIPGRYDTGIGRIFNGNNGTSCQQKLLSGPLQMYDGDAITFPLVDILLHLEVKMSIQEYELIHQDKEDEKCLRKYRRRCMQDMHQRLSFGPRYGFVYELENGEQFLETIEKEQKIITIVVHIYEDGIKGCDGLNNSLACLAAEYPMVKFCKIKASNTGAGDRFSPEVLPTLLVYKGGQLISNFISVTEQFAEEFFSGDVESFLNEYGLLPGREFHALEQTTVEEEEIE